MLSNIDKNVIYSKIKELTGAPRNSRGSVVKKSNEEVAVGKD